MRYHGCGTRNDEIRSASNAKGTISREILWLMNSNRSLNADFLEIIYRMAAGELPRETDFFVASDMERARRLIFAADEEAAKQLLLSLGEQIEKADRDDLLLEVYAQLGMTDQGIQALEAAWSERDSGLGSIRVDPFLDPLRNDPRFSRIAARLFS